MVTNQEAIRALFRVKYDRAGNLPPLPGIFPNQLAPIVRTGTDGERELTMARWGMPPPPAFRKGTVDRGVTNIRNTASAHWRQWLTGSSLGRWAPLSVSGSGTLINCLRELQN